jgi:transcriptional regulator with PAS, ATPase and Fis domain
LAVARGVTYAFGVDRLTHRRSERLLMSRLDNVTVLTKSLDAESDSVSGSLRAKHIVFVDQASQALLRLLDRIAPSDAAVQIGGETGTGKELVARYIHRKSGRKGPFLAVNCGAISEHLAESELFGHEAGSFTGANSRREGWFEAADQGTLFLDEIADLPSPLQGKLLRVLQEGEVTRIGSRKSTPIDVRIVSASNIGLKSAVAAGKFRQDLLYRLNIVPIALPPLRERPKDIAALAHHFVRTYSARLQRPTPTLSVTALQILQRYAWPGNIRELENVIHYALLIAPEDAIASEHLTIAGFSAPHVADPTTNRVSQALRECFEDPGTSLLRDVERRLIEDAYRYCDSNQVRTAHLLGVSRNVVRTLLKRYSLLSDDDASLIDDEDSEPASDLRHALYGESHDFLSASG